MAPRIIKCEQGSPDWHAARLGIPTASMFSTVMAKGKSGCPSLTRAKYMRELVGERITGQVEEGFSNKHMERGKALEPEARALYAFLHDQKLEQVGFIRNGDQGCSPDSLIGKRGMAEVKTTLPHLLIEIIEADRAPTEHTGQCQGNLWIAERDWIDLIVYWPKMPLFVKRMFRDEAYIKEMAEAVRVFNNELDELEHKVRRYAGEAGLVGSMNAPALLATCTDSATFLDHMADTLDGWAKESQGGGWSTHQVASNQAAANGCRRRAAEIRQAIRRVQA